EDAEHHEVAKERLKRKEFEIFIGGLDKDVVEDDPRKIFSQVGEVTEVKLLINPHTKKNKGFKFLLFATVEQAKRACIELKNPAVNGKKCGVSLVKTVIPYSWGTYANLGQKKLFGDFTFNWDLQVVVKI
ncbi:hypothetical protein MTR67_017970, partial [Solanum verrucosum]